MDSYKFFNHTFVEIFKKEKDPKKAIEQCITFILENSRSTITLAQTDVLRNRIYNLRSKYIVKWKKSNYSIRNFELSEKSWLDTEFTFSFEDIDASPSTSASSGPSSSASSSTPVTPTKPIPSTIFTTPEFERIAPRTQRKHVLDFSKSLAEQPTKKIILASSKAAQAKGKAAMATLLKKAITSPEEPEIILKTLERHKDEVKYTPDEALAMFIDNRFTTLQYINIREGAKSRNCDIYPPYYRLQLAKKQCRPPITSYITSDKSISVPVSALVIHTVERIIQEQQSMLLQLLSAEEDLNMLKCTAYFTWGFDGSTRQSNYKMKFIESASGNTTSDDSALFATTMIPIRIVSNKNILLWQNPAPQSIRYCRPLKLEFVKETADHCKSEYDNVSKQINNLQNHIIILPNNKTIETQFKLYMTIIDGKVLNAVTDTRSSQCCPICKATPKQFNDLDKYLNTDVFKPKDSESLKHGINPLHARIRFFELCLHISYRLDLKTWRVYKENKAILLAKKQQVQTQMLAEMNLRVDFVSIHGGTTNDGNTSRKAFERSADFARILGIDEELVQMIKTLLIALNCKFLLDREAFRHFCDQLARKYVSLYSWFPMSATLHKILIHGADIADAIALPLGMIGEEAAESRNKLYRQDREFHARKKSRQANLTDVFNAAMDSSDPLISGLSAHTRRVYAKKSNLPDEVKALLAADQLLEEKDDDEIPDSEGLNEEMDDDEYNTEAYNIVLDQEAEEFFDEDNDVDTE